MASTTSIAQTPITALDLTGFAEREPGVWTDAAGLILSVHFFPLAPDLSRTRPGLRAAVRGRTPPRGGGAILTLSAGVAR